MGTFQALQSLGQLTSSVTAPHSPSPIHPGLFHLGDFASTIRLKCPFFPSSQETSARLSRVHTEMPHLPWHFPTSRGKHTFPSPSSLSIAGPLMAPASQLVMFQEELPLLLTPCGLLSATVLYTGKYFLNAYEYSMTSRSREHYTRKKRKWFQNSQSGCQLFFPRTQTGTLAITSSPYLEVFGETWGIPQPK